MTAGSSGAVEEKPVALVTAASRGIGEAIARQLARRGYKVALLARSDSVDTLAEELGGFAMKGSVANADDLSAFVEAAVQKFGTIDAVVNNTGHPPRGDLLSISDDQWHEALDLVMLNVIRMSRLVVPVMLEKRRGALLNISTVGAIQPDVMHPVSAVLRCGVGAYAKLFAKKYAASGLRMNNILPGHIESYPQPEGNILEIPAKRLGKTLEIAQVASFLLSDEASYINGQSIIVDGGLVKGV